MSAYEITDVRPIAADMMTTEGHAATVTLADGSSLGVSHVATDPDGVWAVDSYFTANGAPQWCNGEGARYLSVRTVNDHLAAELTRRVTP